MMTITILPYYLFVILTTFFFSITMVFYGKKGIPAKTSMVSQRYWCLRSAKQRLATNPKTIATLVLSWGYL